MHIAKKGLRVLGIAESFSGRERSTLAGIVMRKDLRIDGAAFATVTVGGMDATEAVLRIVRVLDRRDINLIMISGSVIAWFNIIDPAAVMDETGLPVIVVTYESSEGIEEDILHHFPGDPARLAAYRRLGGRTAVDLRTGHTIYIRPHGIALADAARLCDDVTLDGKVPEPIRAARLVARGTMRSGICG